MKIADAMRAGSSGMNQHFEDYFNRGSAIHSCCAMGAVILGVGLTTQRNLLSGTMELVSDKLPLISSKKEEVVGPLISALSDFNFRNPGREVDVHMKTLGELIVQANDLARFPISKIADLVEQGELAVASEQEAECSSL